VTGRKRRFAVDKEEVGVEKKEIGESEYLMDTLVK
jgi:hypothetical protein